MRTSKEVMTGILALFVLCQPLSVLGEETPRDGLVAHYPFTGDADDASGNGNNGTINGAAPTPDRFGNPDSALRFDGSDDWIRVDNSPTLNIHGDVSISVCAWIKAESFASRRGIVNKWGRGMAVDDQYCLRLRNDRVNFGLSDEVTYTTSRTSLQTGRWYFIAGLYDADRDRIEIFIDGTLDRSDVLDFAIWDTKQFLEIGKDEYSHWHGLIDDVRIYDRVLSEEEILALYQEGGWSGAEDNSTFVVSGDEDVPVIAAPVEFEFTDDLEGWLKSEGPGSFSSRDGRMYHQGPKWCSYYYPALVPPNAVYEFAVNVVPGVWGTSLVVGLQEGFAGHDLSFRSTEHLDGSLFVTFNTSPIVSDERLLRVEYIAGTTRHVLHESPSPFGEHSVRVQIQGRRMVMAVDGNVLLDAVVEEREIREGYMALKSGDGGSGDGFDRVRVTPLERVETPISEGTGGRALSLDGDGDHVSIPDDESLYSDQITIELWFKLERMAPENLFGWSVLLANDEFELAVRAGDRHVVACCYNAPSVLPNDTIIEIDRWYHAALINDGEKQKILLNGQQDSILEGVRIREPHQELWIGNDPSPPTRPFAGQIDEVRLWDRALSEEEIRGNRHRTLSGDEAGLMAYYPFDALDAEGKVPDLSGNGNHGTLNGDAHLTEREAPVDDRSSPDGEADTEDIWDRLAYQGEFAGHAYYLADFTTSWRRAKVLAEASGGYLVVISSAAENEFVGRIARQVEGTGVWIGYTDAEEEGRFTWVVDEGSTYTHWDPGEPSNRGLYGPEHYVQIYGRVRDNATWNDLADPYEQAFVVEVPSPGEPEPEPEREPTPIPDPSLFRILSITDVSNDQGRQVHLTWHRHPNDRESAYPQITQYSLWRRFDPELPSVRPKAVASDFGTQPEGEWTFVAAVPAKGVETYRADVPTRADSTARSGVYYSVFLVTAHTEDAAVTFDCPPDSGYSVNDGMPPLPRYFTGVAYAGKVKLVWEPVATGVVYYAIYRGSSPVFSAEQMHGMAVGPKWEENYDAQKRFYRMAAVDFSGIRSLVSEVVEVKLWAEVETWPEDFDGDGTVALVDFFLLVDAVGTSEARYDLDGNGQVGMGDFLLFADRFGTGTQP